MTPLIEMRDVAVNAGGHLILQIERLAIPEGETTAVLGPNGAGKSTLLRVVGGLRTHDAGAVHLSGQPSRAAARRAVSAAVLQRPLLRRGTVRKNVESGLRFRRTPKSDTLRRAQHWLDRLGLGAISDRAAHALSGGEAQRTSLARALALEPRLLLLDEPFGALDAPTRSELLADLCDVLAASGTTTLLVTHDHGEAAAISHHIAILEAGRLRQTGHTRDVFHTPADATCAGLLGYDNIVPAALASRLLGRTVHRTVALCATDCTLAADGTPGRLVRLLPHGAQTRVIVDLDGHTVTATAPNPAPAWLASALPGSIIGLRASQGAGRELR